MNSTTPLQETAVKRKIEEFVSNENYDDLEHYIKRLYDEPNGKDILWNLARKQNGLDNFTRTVIKSHIPLKYYENRQIRTPVALRNDYWTQSYGGTKRRRRRKQTKKKNKYK